MRGVGCNEPGCDRICHARGYCQWHYVRHRRHGNLPPIRHVAPKPAGNTCRICHRQLLDHRIGEWCLIEERYK